MPSNRAKGTRPVALVWAWRSARRWSKPIKGRITAESAAGMRARPSRDVSGDAETTGARATSVPPAAAPRAKSMRVLLVEDHEDTNRSLTQLLRRRGYDVQAARSVQSALSGPQRNAVRRLGQRYWLAGRQRHRSDEKPSTRRIRFLASLSRDLAWRKTCGEATTSDSIII